MPFPMCSLPDACYYLCNTTFLSNAELCGEKPHTWPRLCKSISYSNPTSNLIFPSSQHSSDPWKTSKSNCRVQPVGGMFTQMPYVATVCTSWVCEQRIALSLVTCDHKVYTSLGNKREHSAKTKRLVKCV